MNEFTTSYEDQMREAIRTTGHGSQTRMHPENHEKLAEILLAKKQKEYMENFDSDAFVGKETDRVINRFLYEIYKYMVAEGEIAHVIPAGTKKDSSLLCTINKNVFDAPNIGGAKPTKAKVRDALSESGMVFDVDIDTPLSKHLMERKANDGILKYILLTEAINV